MRIFTPSVSGCDSSKYLIYKLPGKYGQYKIVSGENKRVCGIFVARPEFVKEEGVYPGKTNFWAYNVIGFYVKQKYNGIGTVLADFLKSIAKKDKRCNGRIFLRAFNNIEPNGRASSTWWHKQGFRCVEPEAEEDVQRVLRKQQTKFGDWYMDVDMYLPEDKI